MNGRHTTVGALDFRVGVGGAVPVSQLGRVQRNVTVWNKSGYDEVLLLTLVVALVACLRGWQEQQ